MSESATSDDGKLGHLITLEGGEGAGKSTCMRSAIEVLVEHGIDVVKTREPGGTRLGERLRDILLDPATGKIGADAELLMMFASRAQHIDEVIEPALRAGRWVLSDRFTDASYAYQGGGRGLPVSRIAALEDWTQGTLRPGLTILLDLPPEKGLQRATVDRAADRFEHEQLDFYQRVRVAYLQRAADDPNRFAVIDSSRAIAQVIAEVRAVIVDYLGRVNAR